jgi:dTDP-4-amino-4,6-dideoxygalactose transaminase
MQLPIPYTKHAFTETDIAAAMAVLKEGAISQGTQTPAFEAAMAAYTAAKHAIAVSSGSAALHLAVRALGIKPGQKVLTTANTFVATANAILHNGGTVVFADIDPQTFCINIDHARRLLAAHPRGAFAGIIVVHFAGLLVDMPAWRTLADEYGCWLLEDASHALGAQRTVGNVTYGAGSSLAHAAVFSFHATKHITTGEGGMVVTASNEVAACVRLARTNYMLKPIGAELDAQGGWFFTINEAGFNYRLSDINSALGLSQLGRLDQNLEKLRRLAKTYDAAFANSNVKPQQVPANTQHAYHPYVIQTPRRRALYDYLKTKQIYTQVHYVPLHLQPLFAGLGWQAGHLPHTEAYYAHCLSIPMYATLQPEQQQYVIDCIMGFFND